MNVCAGPFVGPFPGGIYGTRILIVNCDVKWLAVVGQGIRILLGENFEQTTNRLPIYGQQLSLRQFM